MVVTQDIFVKFFPCILLPAIQVFWQYSFGWIKIQSFCSSDTTSFVKDQADPGESRIGFEL